MIELSGVSKAFGPVQALQDVDLSVRQGELFGLIGHNGAGKSTLFQIMLGLLRADSGHIRIHGQTVDDKRFRPIRRRLGYLPENVVLYDNLSGLETLRFFARLKGFDPAQSPALLEQVGLQEAGARKVRGYSKGMRQRLGFAQALLGEPDILFLDEPTNGLDPEGIRAFYQTLSALRERGMTVVITSHILAEIQQRVDRLAMLKNGRIESMGSLDALRQGRNSPAWIVLTAQPGAMAALAPSVARLAGCEPAIDGSRLSFPCARDDKMRLLRDLSGLAAHILDIQVREASLEELFLGHVE
ncbi:MAG: ABC transporter ATP-binding protein [Paludibacterium sp.]|uniref:ABC transporter ATP-binding protein n=1 Tax=Paludibacterium sp. TaxID=1917523 RepID=UPI0025DC43A2|nr:ABC transporter ATP-binding protein [Paludibacterium sp.]MBV8045536.1 ABC transporter ATP-binding protein [Paludibacterium sp.]MBV8646131.1 ABC transporter ATP-binding protein [Paludibacterium sp.]